MSLRTPLIASFAAALLLGPPGLCYSSQPAANSRPIVIGERYEMHSEAIGETRSYFVHRPADYDLSSTRYPVLVILDGEWAFPYASTTTDFLADENRTPGMLVVGIPNTNRNRDLVPYAPQSGSAKFLKFITTELLPKLDRDFRTQPYRILVGHSNGGLFGLYAMIGAPGVFKSFVLASPAIGAEDRELPRTVNSFLQSHKDVTASVYLSTANEGDLLSGNLELSSYLQDRAARDSRWSFTFRRYPDETHGSVTLRTLYDGLEFVFDGWRVADPLALYEQGGLAAIEKHYAALSSRLGMTVPIPRDALLDPMFTLYRQKRVDEAEKLILRTIELYPTYTNGYLTAGRLYFDKGDKAKATEYLTKALLISPARRATGVDYAALNLDPAKVVPPVQISASELQKFAGSYGSSAPVLEVERRGNKLFAVMADQEDELTPMSPTRFYYARGGDEVITFRRDDRGKVIGLGLQSRGAELSRLK